jgi:hypothetical protein
MIDAARIIVTLRTMAIVTMRHATQVPDAEEFPAPPEFENAARREHLSEANALKAHRQEVIDEEEVRRWWRSQENRVSLSESRRFLSPRDVLQPGHTRPAYKCTVVWVRRGLGGLPIYLTQL